MNNNKNSIKRFFETKKSEQKAKALHLWRLGKKVAHISKECEVSRETIYRWIESMDRKWSAPTKRARQTVDLSIKSRIVEAFFILKFPSMPLLKRVLEANYHLRLSESKLRRLLQKWDLYMYEPSAMHDSLIRFQFDRAGLSKNVLDRSLSVETAEE